ncbi:MAG: glycosyltransferase family 2 protein, partial [Sphingobacteriales bacterium]
MVIRVIILNYNTVELTLQCVDYVLRQNESNFHIVVVDNGSLDECYQEIKLKLPASVNLIRFENNAGFAAGNNRGCGRIENLPDPDYYLFINSDAFLTEPGTIKTLSTALTNQSQAVAISPLVHTTSNSVPVRFQIQVRRILSPGWLVICHSPILRRLPFARQWHHHFIYRDLVPYSENIYPVESINGAVFMIRSDFLHHIGLLDEGTFLYLEEIVLGEQIRREGRICLLHGGIIVPHIQGATT